MHVKTYFAIGKNPLYVIGYIFHILRMLLQVSFHTQDKFLQEIFILHPCDKTKHDRARARRAMVTLFLTLRIALF